jgi:hypothetical protein
LAWSWLSTLVPNDEIFLSNWICTKGLPKTWLFILHEKTEIEIILFLWKGPRPGRGKNGDLLVFIYFLSTFEPQRLPKNIYFTIYF